MNVKRAYRIYKELGLQLRHKTPKRRVKDKLRDDRAVAVGPNDVWAMDFVHNHLATGNKLRVLTVVDTFAATSQFCTFATAAAAKMWSRRSIGYTERRAIQRRSETTRAASSSLVTDHWAYQRSVLFDFSRIGKPTDNAFPRDVQREVQG